MINIHAPNGIRSHGIGCLVSTCRQEIVLLGREIPPWEMRAEFARIAWSLNDPDKPNRASTKIPFIPYDRE